MKPVNDDVRLKEDVGKKGYVKECLRFLKDGDGAGKR